MLTNVLVGIFAGLAGFLIGAVLTKDAAKVVLKVYKPRPIGHWIEGETYYDAIRCECSLCGEPLTMCKDQPRTKYCPHCGAKMEAEQ